MFGIGRYFYRWIGSADDFQVAGRTLTPFILAATMMSTNMNLYNFIGETGSTYQYGISVIWHEWTGNMALVFAGLFVIPIFRRLKINTIPEYLEMRFGVRVRGLIGILWVLRLSFWLGVVIYTGVTLMQGITEIKSFHFWIAVLAVVTVIYTYLGGMFAIFVNHVLQFIMMLAGSLVLVPIVMNVCGWLPGLIEKLPENHLSIVAPSGPFNWQFTFAIFVLGLQWACTDQGMLQASFGAKNIRTAAKGMILGGLALTAFNFLIFAPGLCARILIPGLENFDLAVPTLLANYMIPGVLGITVCGLMASQMSTIDANLVASATLFTNDVYKTILKKDATKSDILRVTRIATVAAGIMMIVFAYAVPKLGGAVNAYLTLIGIVDMPLFVIAIVYGLLWRRANEKGALWAYFIAAIVAGIARFGFGLSNNLTTFLSAGIALVACPIASLLTEPLSSEKTEKIWKAREPSKEEIESGDEYHIMPKTNIGKISIGIYLFGFLLFVVGTFLGMTGTWVASLLAVLGMLIYFLGGFMKFSLE